MIKGKNSTVTAEFICGSCYKENTDEVAMLELDMEVITAVCAFCFAENAVG